MIESPQAVEEEEEESHQKLPQASALGHYDDGDDWCQILIAAGIGPYWRTVVLNLATIAASAKEDRKKKKEKKAWKKSRERGDRPSKQTR